MAIGSLLTYYGVDYVALVLTLVGLYFVGSKNKYGFVVCATGNILWMAIGILAHSYGLIFVNLGIVALNSRAFINWSSKKKK